MRLQNSAVLLAGGAALFVSCNAGTGWEIPARVDCDPAAFHTEHIRQVSGRFTREELASRGVGDDESAADTEGLVGGRFSLWKVAVDTVPFDAPANTVCQVLLFEGEEGAAAFVASLEASGESLSRASIGWPRGGVMGAEELASVMTGVRVFSVWGSHIAGEQRLLLAFQQAGDYVVAVHSGGPGQSPQLEHVESAIDALAERAIAEAE